MTENESSIEQINLGFNEQEDRLLLKVGLADKTEVAVWISRRVAKQIWSALQQAGSALLPSGSGLSSTTGNATLDKELAMDHFVRDAEMQKKIAQLDFQSAYQSDRKARSDAPLLAITCMTVKVGTASKIIANTPAAANALASSITRAASSPRPCTLKPPKAWTD